MATASGDAELVKATLEALREPQDAMGGSEGQRQAVASVFAPGQLDFPREGVMSLAVSDDLDHPAAIPAARDEGDTVTMVSPTPVPDITNGDLRASASLMWQVEVRNERTDMPRGRGLDGHWLLAPDEDPYLTWVRSGRDGTRFESHRWNFTAAGTPRLSQLARPRLRELSVMQWASCLARQQAKSVRLSDAGRRAEVLHRSLGDRRSLAATFAGPMLPVLRAFLTTAKQSMRRYPNQEGVVLHRAGTNDSGHEGYLTFEGMAAFDERDDKEALAGDVDVLTTAGLLRRGLIVNCGTCGRASFIDLDRAAHVNECLRCRARNELTQARWKAPLEGPTWYFDLHPVARDLLRDNGEVPLQLAVYLRDKARRYDDAAEFELLNEAGSPIAEVDLLAHADGQLIVAEAKSNAALGENPKTITRAARKRTVLASAFQADQILLATSEPEWDNRSLTAVREAVQREHWSSGATPILRIITRLGSAKPQDSRMDVATGSLSAW